MGRAIRDCTPFRSFGHLRFTPIPIAEKLRALQKVDNMQTKQTADLPEGLYVILLNDEMIGKFIKE